MSAFRALRVGMLALLAGVGACSRGPSEQELKGWLAETHREDEAQRAKVLGAEAATWTISVRGNVAGDGADYSWPRITTLAKTHLRTTNPAHTSNPTQVMDYRGISLLELLEASAAREDAGAPGGSEVTLVAADGFLHSVPWEHVRRFPILLAIEQDGVPLVKKTGGPVLELFPHTSHPESLKLYGEGGAYYVTTVIAGTERLALAVNGRTFGAEDLARLGQHSVHGKAGFRFRWPSGAVKITGPRLRDVLSSAGVVVHGTDRVLVRRKPRTDTKEREVTTLRGADVLACDVLVGTRYGESSALIPAVMGGPAVLAFSGTCPNASLGQPWPTFVESIEVQAGASASDAGDAPDAIAGEGGR